MPRRMTPRMEAITRNWGSQADMADVLDTYTRLHEGKLFCHWLWAVIERVNAGESVDSVLADYGYQSPVRRAEEPTL